MRIMFVQKNFHPNSVGQFEGLAARGHEVIGLMQYVDGAKSGVSSSPLRPERLDYGRLSHWVWRKNRKRLDQRALPRTSQLVRSLRRERPDVVVVKGLRTTSTVTALLAPLFGARVVLSWEKPKRARKSWWLLAGGGLFLPRMKFHMGHYGRVGEDFDLGNPVGLSRLLPYPVAPHPSAAPAAVSTGRTQVVAVGSLNNRRKRMSWLTEAVIAAGLSEEVDITYVGLGSEDSFFFREIRDIEQRNGMPPATILLNLPHSELTDLLPRFDLFVLPARNEPFGAVVPEAMAAGLPVICSSTCGSRVCLEDGVSGRIFPAQSFEEFAAALAELVRDDELRRMMAVAAYRRVEEELNPIRWAEMFEDLVECR